MAKYPINLELSGRRVVVIGGGEVAARKTAALSGTAATVIVVAEQAAPALQQTCLATKTELIMSSYSKDYLAGVTLAIAATNDSAVNRQVYDDCRQLNILCNIVDQPELCDFFIPAVLKRGHLQIAISTDGRCPAYARQLRKKLEEMFTEDHGRFADELEVIRKKVIEEVGDSVRRGQMLARLADEESFEYFVKSGTDSWRNWAEGIVSGKPY